MPIDIQPITIDPISITPITPIDSKADAQLQAKLDTLVRKDVGVPVTIVQRKQTISSVAVVLDEKGRYSLVVSYQNAQVDGDGNVLGAKVSAATEVLDEALSDEIKKAIDSIYTAALAAI